MKSSRILIGPDDKLREFVAYSYLTDAIDFIARSGIEVLSDTQWHRSYRAKVFVDILHICECSLKSIYVLLAPTELTAEKLYQSIRKRRHNIYGLASDIDAILQHKRGFLSPYQMSFLKTASTIGANARYDLDVFSISLHWQRFTKVIGPKKHASIKSVRWLRRFHWLALRIFGRAFSVYTHFISQTQLDPKKSAIYNKQLQSFADVIATRGGYRFFPLGKLWLANQRTPNSGHYGARSVESGDM